ncbi:MAG: hypothetical protein HC939_13825, partial [Pleurocapsa sp. SU_5_0]|nr:hypothetical protein [Pleurocapsa sp. SU_5_0]
SANNSEVEGAGYGYRHGYYRRRAFNVAGAEALAEAKGFNTKAFTSTHTLVIEGNYSGSGSSSYSESF